MVTDGSAARAMLIETMQTQGVDSFPALVAATIQGKTVRGEACRYDAYESS